MKKINYDNNAYFEKLDKYFRAANYLSVAQLYLLKNPLLREPLKKEDIKTRIVGHWGTIPGQNFIYAHLNRVINKYDLNMIYISGPGHGGNFFLANSYLEGTYSEFYPKCSMDKEGMTRFCKQFSFPHGVSSHVAPEAPGSMHEGGELGYSLLHGFGAVLDNKDLIAAVVVGDGEAETGPLATSWHSNKFINPVTDGAVLPILHLNGYKINNPTVLARLPKDQLAALMYGYGYKAYFVEGREPKKMHRLMAKAMDCAVQDIKNIQTLARSGKLNNKPIWPMIVLRTPKGWTGPKIVDNKQVEGSFRAHQVPVFVTSDENFKLIERWLKSYRPEELFDEDYKLKSEIADILPKGDKRLCANPITNGGKDVKDLVLPDIRDYEVKFSTPGSVKAQDMIELGKYIRDIFKLNKDNKNYRIFSPDEAVSNRLNYVFEEEKRDFNGQIIATDENLAADGRVMDSYLSEHACEGWLEGYVLTGRHGMFASYEAFARVVDSMVSQHAKWLKIINDVKWRKPIPSLNLILTSNVWQQDHNGYTHQEPGFLNHIISKKPELTRIYLPADANTLLCCYNKAETSKNKINVIVASKHPTYQWLDMDRAIKHCEQGVSVWEWASTGKSKTPDIVIASAGDTATIEALATVTLIKRYMPKLNVRFVNVVDLMKLMPKELYSNGLTDEEFDKIFTKNKPVLFNFHGYPNLIRELICQRNNKNFDIHGYTEEGSITTAFDMRVQNKIDRFNLLKSVVKLLNIQDEALVKEMDDKLKKHNKYIEKYGVDMPEIENWKWE